MQSVARPASLRSRRSSAGGSAVAGDAGQDRVVLAGRRVPADDSRVETSRSEVLELAAKKHLGQPAQADLDEPERASGPVRRARRHVLVQLHPRVGLPVDRELRLHPRSTGRPEPRSEGRVAPQLEQGRDRGLRIARGDDESLDAVANRFRRPADVRHDDRQRAGHRLEDGVREPLDEAQVQKGVASLAARLGRRPARRDRGAGRGPPARGRRSSGGRARGRSARRSRASARRRGCPA